MQNCFTLAKGGFLRTFTLDIWREHGPPWVGKTWAHVYLGSRSRLKAKRLETEATLGMPLFPDLGKLLRLAARKIPQNKIFIIAKPLLVPPNR